MGRTEAGYCWLCSIHSLPLSQNSHSRQPGTMGRKKIQISRILDQRNRQVSSWVTSPLGEVAFRAGARPDQGHFGESETESLGSASGAQCSQKRTGHLGGVANTQRSFPA